MVDAIIEAATRVFSEDGFDAATTNGIAARAGVSVGSLYQYFPNKVALLAALKERHVILLLTQAATACHRGCSMPWPGGLRHLVDTIACHNGRNAGLFALFHRELPAGTPMPPLGDQPSEITVAKQTHDDALRCMLTTHRAHIAVEVEEAVRVIPAIGKGVFAAMFIDDPQYLHSGRIADQLMKIMLSYLTTPPTHDSGHHDHAIDGKN